MVHMHTMIWKCGHEWNEWRIETPQPGRHGLCGADTWEGGGGLARAGVRALCVHVHALRRCLRVMTLQHVFTWHATGRCLMRTTKGCTWSKTTSQAQRLMVMCMRMECVGG